MNNYPIIETITSLTTIYERLNHQWNSDPCSVDRYQVLRQEKYKSIFETLNQSRFEELVLQIVSENLNKAVLARLQTLIENNIRIYETKESLFNGLDFYELNRVDEQEEFATRFEILQNDLKDIQEFEYPTEQEKQMLLAETRQEINQLQTEKGNYIRERAWIGNNYYPEIYQLSKSFLNIINSYFPEKEGTTKISIQEKETATPAPIDEVKPAVEYPAIEPDMIFRARMYERFLLLEQRLIKDNYLDKTLHWVSTHENKRSDIKSLVVFLVGLHANNYFLPNKDPKIKQYFETRYHIKIGQNFEKKRRELLADDYKIIFHDYLF